MFKILAKKKKNSYNQTSPFPRKGCFIINKIVHA